MISVTKSQQLQHVLTNYISHLFCSKDIINMEPPELMLYPFLQARLMGQYCFVRGRLSSSVMLQPLGTWTVGALAAGRVDRQDGRHCTAGQYGYVPLGRHLVLKVVQHSCYFPHHFTDQHACMDS